MNDATAYAPWMPLFRRLGTLARRMTNPLLMSSDLIDEFASYIAVNSSNGNGHNYRLRMSSFLSLTEGKRTADLTPGEADKWAIGLRERGLKPATRYAYILTLRRFEKFLRERYPDEVSDRPFSLHLKPPKVHIDLTDKIASTAHIFALVAVSERWLASSRILDIRDAAVFFWILETGSRRNEVVTQQRRHLGLDSPTLIREPDGGTVYIYEAVISQAKTGRITGVQTVDYTERMAEILRRWLSVRPAADRMGNTYDHLFVIIGKCGRHRGRTPDGCPICAPHGRPMTGWAVRKGLQRLSDEAGIPHVSPHSIRHWFGQRVLDTTNLEIARQRLRHADIRLTASTYGHQDRSRRQAGAIASSVLKRPAGATVDNVSIAPPEHESS